ncbi:hypothetical protein Golomagni_00726 [Golovinomyces magnicellulatus]|nr:hypothetical protein Golomagni_00726 [Golovinomyces magnicellulatus]
MHLEVSPSIFHTSNIVRSNPFIISAIPSSSTPTSAPSIATKSELASTTLTYLSYYIDRDLYDEELFWEFKQDFDGWKRSHFDTAGILRKDLKRILLERGIILSSKGYPDSAALEMVFADEEPHALTSEEITAALKRKTNYHPRFAILQESQNPNISIKAESGNYQNRGQAPRQPGIRKATESSCNISVDQQKYFIPPQSIGSQHPQHFSQDIGIENRTDSFWVLPPVPNVRRN